MINDTGKSYKVISKNSKRNLGEYGYTTLQGKKRAYTLAKKRLRQVEFFKHNSK